MLRFWKSVTVFQILLLLLSLNQASSTAAQTPINVYVVGDIAGCDWTTDDDTALVLANTTGPILALGDLIYPRASREFFATCFEPSWGHLKPRMFPVAGNHDWPTGNTAAYFEYFGEQARPPNGYYSFDQGSWHIVALSSECDTIDCPAQLLWLMSDLSAHQNQCTIVYWHGPVFASSTFARSPQMQPVWDLMYKFPHTTVVLNGHAHSYERFAPQDPTGNADPNGIQQFVVGTGGAPFTGFSTPITNSVVRNNDTYGVLQISLSGNSYSWSFLRAAGGTLTDTGSGQCANRPSQITPVHLPVAIR